MADDLLKFDFGFTAVDESELEAVQEVSKKASSTEAEVKALEDKLNKLYNSILPLLSNLKKNPDKEYIVFCGVGGQGTLATKTMKDMGVKNVKNISGGIAEWDKIKEK